MWKTPREVAIFLCTCLVSIITYSNKAASINKTIKKQNWPGCFIALILAVKNVFGNKFKGKSTLRRNGSNLDHKPQHTCKSEN